MTRFLLVLCGVCGLCAALSAAPAALLAPAALTTTGAALSGRILSSTAGTGVGGVALRLHTTTPAGPGAVLDTATTSADGSFSLQAGATSGRYYVELVDWRYQGGYVGGSPRQVQSSIDAAQGYGPRARLGKILAEPGFIAGTVVSSDDGITPVAGVKVTVRTSVDLGQVDGLGYTDGSGRFSLSHVECQDDCYLRFSGAGVGYETGYLACDKTVVADFDDACAAPLGQVGGRIQLDPQ